MGTGSAGSHPRNEPASGGKSPAVAIGHLEKTALSAVTPS